MQAAQAWGLAPGDWRRKSVDDRARMMASEMVKGVRQTWLGESVKPGAKSKPELNDYEKQKLAMRAAAQLAEA